jgi:TolB-like protein/class 3 adenylate cyclase/Flp pilus assembly protein TadD
MPAEVKKEIQLEIAHVLFTDIVGYSKLPINEQRALVERLNEIVRSTDEFQAAESAGRLIKIPTGDGITLVFYHSPEAPVECALEISRALKKHPELQLRMGIHSGPVSGVIDVTGKANVAGGGINMAQRVMDCGDAGHILLSKHVAEDLEQYPHWQPHLHELGECEVKHGVRVSVVNLYTEELGNPAMPEKLKVGRVVAAPRRKRAAFRWLLLGVVALLVGIATIGFLAFRYGSRFAGLAPAAPEKSIAVLPFENLSEDKANAFFADGVQDEILTDLARIADLKVISRASVMQYKSGIARNLREIRQQLGVANVVEGSVQRAGNRVRVNAQLVDTRTDKHLWAQTYDRDLADVFAIQSEIAKTIASQLQAKLSPAEKIEIEQPPTTNLIAYDCYLRAKKLSVLNYEARIFENVRQSIRLLDEAVAHDPTFLLAYCELARRHIYLYFLGADHTPARVALAKAARDAALRLGADRGEPHLAAAWVAYQGYLDYETALNEVGIARRRLPNEAAVFDISAYITRRQGQWEQCIRNLKRVAERDPRNVGVMYGTAHTYQFLRRFSDMAQALDRALVIVPRDATSRVWRAQGDLESRADTQPEHDAIKNIVTEDPSAADVIAERWLDLALCRRDATETASALASLSPEGMQRFNVAMPRSFCEGLAARAQGDVTRAETAFTAARDEMEKIVREQPDYAQALCVLGMIDAALGRKEDAIREGRRAVELLPVTKDAWTGAEVLTNLAITYAWAGEKELAIKQLEELVRIPSPVSYGQLRLHPFWDPLRGDPRFEKIVEEAKQPVALKEAVSK